MSSHGLRGTQQSCSNVHDGICVQGIVNNAARGETQKLCYKNFWDRAKYNNLCDTKIVLVTCDDRTLCYFCDTKIVI